MIRFIRKPQAQQIALGASLLSLALGTASAQVADTARAPAAADTAMTTTLSRVFTAEQASKGRQVYLLVCVSCHSPSDHTGGGFWKDLVGQTVGQFFSYLRNNMPQDDAGSITEDDYVNVTAYVLALNSMPIGNVPLMRDSTLQAKIRIVEFDSTKVSPVDTTAAPDSSHAGLGALAVDATSLMFHQHSPKARHVPRHTIR